MPLHGKQFSAWISIDGKEIPEYSVEISDDQKTVTCWIASELGKRFIVHNRNESYYDDTKSSVRMDGKYCGGFVTYARTVPQTCSNKGVSDGTSLKPFIFSRLELTDDDAFLGDASEPHQDLGVIEVTISPIQATSVRPRGTAALAPFLSQAKVHERAKKTVTQQITLGQPERLAKPGSFVTCLQSGPDLVKFRFKYRPLDILQANGIAPLPPRKACIEPESVPTADEGPANAEEAKLLRARLRVLEATATKENKPRVKRELEAGAVIDLTQNERSKRVKREAKQPFISGEVIDLT